VELNRHSSAIELLLANLFCEAGLPSAWRPLQHYKAPPTQMFIHLSRLNSWK